MSKPLGPKQVLILETLDADRWTPGPLLADKLGIPKHVLWPYIERLRDRGYGIAGDTRGVRFDGVRSQGYRLLWLADGSAVG